MGNWTGKRLQRMQVSGILLGLLLVVGVAIPAAARGLDEATTATAAQASFSTGVLAKALPADVSFLADADQQRAGAASAPQHQVGDKQAIFMVQGGLLFCCSNTGFVVGGGASVKPMKDNDKFEVGGDFNFARIYSSNGLYVSINGQYDIHLQDSKLLPFVGGGLGITHGSGFTDTNLQILGGVDFETGGGKALRAQVRFLFTPGAMTTILMIGYAF